MLTKNMLLKNENKNGNVLDLIGNTPIVKINRLNPNPNVTIYAKLEGQNPGGSVKDRIALSMIEAAEKSGELNKNKTILEPTSGNTGIGLALVGAAKDYRVILTMSAGMSQERKLILKALGAEVIETDQEKGTDGAIEKAREMFKGDPNKYWMPNQFDNPNNPLAHYHGTGKEIIEQLPDINVFFAGMGTSGTLMGTSRRLKEYNENIKIVGVEPHMNHKIHGLKNMKEAIVPKIYNPDMLDKIVEVDTEDAYRTAKLTSLTEGIFVGMSSGAALHAAIKYAGTIKRGKILVLFPDRGEKYLSTILYNGK